MDRAIAVAASATEREVPGDTADRANACSNGVGESQLDAAEHQDNRECETQFNNKLCEIVEGSRRARQSHARTPCRYNVRGKSREHRCESEIRRLYEHNGRPGKERHSRCRRSCRRSRSDERVLRSRSKSKILRENQQRNEHLIERYDSDSMYQRDLRSRSKSKVLPVHSKIVKRRRDAIERDDSDSMDERSHRGHHRRSRT